MITHKVSVEGYTQYHEENMWIQIQKGYNGNKPRALLYHHCPKGNDSNVLLVEETFERKCHQCGPVEYPDDLWALYVLLDGRGVYRGVE